MQTTTTDGVPESVAGGGSESVDRRQAIQKIAVGGAIIWGAPLIIGSTAAQAAGSVCGDRKLSWRTVGGDPLTLPRTIVLDDATVSITETFSGVSGTHSEARDPDLDVLDGPYGGVGSRANSFLQLYQKARQPNGRKVTFTFTKTGTPTLLAVKNISFWITDIDYTFAQYDDRVILTPAFTGVAPPGSTVIGAGTTGNAFRNNEQGNVAVGSVKGSTRVTRAAATSTFTVDFLCGTRASGGNHAIFISDIEFNTCP